MTTFDRHAFAPLKIAVGAILALAAFSFSPGLHAADEPGWLTWRGPNQNGFIEEKNLPETWTLGGENNLWTAELSGQSTPVIFNGKLYIMGFEGEGPDMREGIYCFDAETGKLLWKDITNDFLSDIIYLRYASSTPCVDPVTGNVYTQGTQGQLTAYTGDGKQLWVRHMMEDYGRMTFPNGRTASPAVDGDLVITHGITANWGGQGPAAHRFYAFNKITGDMVWASQPGDRPKDSCFCNPVFGNYQNQRVFWCGGGDGGVYCVNARTGRPLWRFTASLGGVNACLLALNDGNDIIAIHGSENIDAATSGRMINIRPNGALPPAGSDLAVVLKHENETWRNDLCAFTASPALANGLIYEVDETADLNCVDPATGKILWKHDLGIEQRTSGLIVAGGLIFVPVLDGNFYIIRPKKDGCDILSKVKVEGRCFGSPAAWNGRVYFQTTKNLYCIGKKDGRWRSEYKAPQAPPAANAPLAGLLVTPSEFLIAPGQKQEFKLTALDANGNWLAGLPAMPVPPSWEKYIPPTAKVKAMINGTIEHGVFTADAKPMPSAGAIKAAAGDTFGVTRGRVMPDLPLSENFDAFKLMPSETNPNDKFAYPPLPWIGARFKWEIREKDGNNCLVKTVENKLFQRAFTFVGNSSMKNYTVRADVMSDGASRKVGGKLKIAKMSEVGLINQRYAIILKGNFQQIEINSNLERLQYNVPFEWVPNVWYTLITRVDVDANTGEGVVRAKAFKKGEAEPDAWTIEFKHKTAHKQGSPGIFGFTPQDMPVYVDNFSVTPNK